MRCPPAHPGYVTWPQAPRSPLAHQCPDPNRVRQTPLFEGVTGVQDVSQCSSRSHCSKKGKFKGNWTRNFKHRCSRGKLLHEYPSGSVHMDSRRAPAVLLLIKTVVITFPILSEQGLRGAAARRAENVSSRLTGSSPPCYRGVQRAAPPGCGGASLGEPGLNRCVSESLTV